MAVVMVKLQRSSRQSWMWLPGWSSESRPAVMAALRLGLGELTQGDGGAQLDDHPGWWLR
jgi:hypothetical protein